MRLRHGGKLYKYFRIFSLFLFFKLGNFAEAREMSWETRENSRGHRSTIVVVVVVEIVHIFYPSGVSRQDDDYDDDRADNLFSQEIYRKRLPLSISPKVSHT